VFCLIVFVVFLDAISRGLRLSFLVIVSTRSRFKLGWTSDYFGTSKSGMDNSF
jgi:hypothetical protein